MHAKYSGRLELTWTNKDKRLLAHDDISYEWVSPADYRVSEERFTEIPESDARQHDIFCRFHETRPLEAGEPLSPQLLR